MNALDFVFTPHNYLPSNFPFPFTVPATSSLITAASGDVSTVTTPAAALATGAALAATEAISSYNTSTPIGFLLYIAAQSQKIFVSGSPGGILFGGPTRGYWMLTLFMVRLSVILSLVLLLNRVVRSSQPDYDIRFR